MKIKKSTASTVLFAVTSALVAGSVSAQSSSVTTYGVIDTIVRYTNNEITIDDSRGNSVRLDQGAFQGSRLGFKGTEDLGNGAAALFQLEMGLAPDTGASEQQGQLFGRQAFVGLRHNKLGEIDLGRQYGVAFDMLAKYDPLSTGNLPENSWQLFITGLRFDNTLKYTNTWGPVSAEVQYSFGEQPGTFSRGSTAGLGLNYATGPFSVGIYGQQSTDANSNKAKVAGIGGSFAINTATLYANYINARRDSGFAIAASNSGGSLANTSMLGNLNNALQRTDNVGTVGVVYQATPSMAYTVGYMADFVKNETSSGNSGRISTLYGIADYNLSKRTDIYLSLDYTRVSGGEVDNGDLTNTVLQFIGSGLGGASSRTGVGIGLRTKF